MPVTDNAATLEPEHPHIDTLGSNEAINRKFPGIREQTVHEVVLKVLDGLTLNSQDVQEEGGLPLAQDVKDFVAAAASEIATNALLNRSYSVEDLSLTAGARMDGGAHLLVDFARTDKRISLRIRPDAKSAYAAMTGRGGAEPGQELTLPGQVAQLLGWLTRPE